MRYSKATNTTLLAASVLGSSLGGMVHSASAPVASPQAEVYRTWIEQMKTSPRGPFVNIRWFCKDGSVLPPKSYACADHGGGYQHGALSKNAEILRQEGYWVANLLAGIDAPVYIAEGNFEDKYNQLLIEQFLINIDNGWIMREALFYRGAFQEEDERKGARQLLTELAGQAEWIGQRYGALRIGVRLLPHGMDTASVQKVRQLSASLADEDPGFKGLRGKIHGSPDAGDAQVVRAYAAGVRDQASQEKYIELAAEIDLVYRAEPLPQLLEENAKIFSGGLWLQKLLRGAAGAYGQDDSARNQFAVTAQLLSDLREALPKIRSSSARLRVLDLSLAVEAANFSASTQIRQELSSATREQCVVWMKQALQAAYGTGFINHRSTIEANKALAKLEQPVVQLETFVDELRYLGRIPEWGTQGLRYQFYEAMAKLATVEPLALHFIQDQLRGSPLLFFSQLLDGMTRDGNQLVGVKHNLFGQEIGVGFHALNPGLARGTLHAQTDMNDMGSVSADGIYVLPETISDLPPLAGIITAGEGNPLSHVQLLARNLGIPNVTVAESLLPQLQAHDGKTIIMAVSPSGLVELADDNVSWQKLFGEYVDKDNVIIHPDLDKLDLSVRRIIDLGDLRADDSGRTVGPKAAKLGELRHHFPGKVANGVAIPFGVFREVVLDQPYKNSQNTVFEWMVEQYAAIRALPQNSTQRKQTTETFRAELYDIILGVRLGDQFKQQLRTALLDTFGTTDIGLFIRSDTNVEDLPGFTGAGLNLTLPNVVGYDGVVEGIVRVWASPFTARAFAWRQSHMEQPEHVYPAALLLRSVANEKSGVMVTQDIDTGAMDVLSVAVNEGVGGAVDGQSAESIRINTEDGEVTLLATATAPWRRVPSTHGGLDKLPVSGDEVVLKPGEIKQLVEFSEQLLVKFPPIVDDKGDRAAADIEFGFVGGELQLFQLRPFLQSDKAQGNQYLIGMDEKLRANMNQTVNMKQ